MGKLADFIEKNRAGVRQLKTTLSALEGTGKCPLLVAKQFRGDQRRRNRGAIHANKSLGSTLRTLMYSARNQFLPGACFARNQHGRVGGSDFHDAGEDSFQGGRGAHDLLKHEDLIDLLPEDHVLVMKAVFQPLDFFESLLQLTLSALPVVNVSQQHVPARDTTFRISRGEGARLEPAVHAIGTPLAELKIMRLPGFDRVLPRVDHTRKLIRMYSVPGGPILQFLSPLPEISPNYTFQ